MLLKLLQSIYDEGMHQILHTKQVEHLSVS